MNTLAPPPLITDQGEYRLLDTASLTPSKTNPRTRRGLDEVSLNELAASIRSVGVMQPILVRNWQPGMTLPHGKVFGDMIDHFEIIAGERRWRAATIAGLPQVPVLVRDLTDDDVLKFQLIENIEREDLDALEEAEGYDKLMQQKDAEGKLYTAERIAEIMGVSKGTIYARLKLLALCPEAREAFIKGQLDASRGLLIARIPVHKLQIEALKAIIEQELSYRQAQQLIHEEYMLDLARAAWSPKDAELLPKAGACTECTKRTGNQPGLFDDVKSKDVCTDPVCFGMKKTAHVLKLQKDAEAQGHKVIPAKEAKKILPNPFPPFEETSLHQHGLAKLTECIPNDKNGTTWEKALNEKGLLKPKEDGKPAVQQTIIEHPHHNGEVIQAITIEQAAKMLRETGFEVKLRTEAQQPAGPSKKQKEEDAKLEHQLKVENTWRARLFDTLHQQIEADITSNGKPEIMPALFLLLAEDAASLADSDLLDKLCSMHCPDITKGDDEEAREDAFIARLPQLTMQQHFMILLDSIMYSDTETNKWQIQNNKAEPQILNRVAKIAGIDAAAMKQEVENELAALAKAEAPAEKKKPGKKAKGEKA